MAMNIGGIAFIGGLVIAAVVAILGSGGAGTWAIWVLAVLGIIVGLMNVTGKESLRFLVATITFIITFNALATVIAVIPLGMGDILVKFFQMMVVFVSPAAAVVAISSLLTITRD
jgi:ATP synthase protein I